MVTSIYFIRHGQIDGNVQRRWYGSTDQGLNEEGFRQARCLADHLVQNDIHIDHLYCSPYKRTRSTAEQIGFRLGLEPNNHHGLVEYAIGVLETTPYEELVTHHRFFEAIEKDLTFAPEGGESVVDVADRMIKTLGELHNQHKGETLAIVSHGAAMGVMLSQLIDQQPFPFHPYHMDNTAMTKLLLSDGGAELAFFNQFDHLAPEKESRE